MDDSGISIRTDTSGGMRVLRASGELSIASAAELRQALAAALGEGGCTVLDLSSLSAADLSGMQLLYSARQSWLRAGRQLEFEGVPAWLREMAEQAGCKPLRSEGARGGCLNGEDNSDRG